MWINYNPNPIGRNVGDCAIRAVAKAMGVDWETAFAIIIDNAYIMGDMPSSDAVWGATLRKDGFYKELIPNTCPDCYTARDFCEEHQHGTYVLGFGGHVATVVDGNLYDSWNSENEIPIYYWYRKEE